MLLSLTLHKDTYIQKQANRYCVMDAAMTDRQDLDCVVNVNGVDGQLYVEDISHVN